MRGRRVTHYIDNSGALACLVKDYSADVDSGRIVHTFWALACALDIDVWFDYVKSDANIADWPSRGHLAFAAEVDALHVEPSFPPVAGWGSVAAATAWAEPAVARAAEPPPKRHRRR